MDIAFLAALREAKGDRTTTREIVEQVHTHTEWLHRAESKMYYMAYKGNTDLLTKYRIAISSASLYRASVLYVYALESGNAVLKQSLRTPRLQPMAMMDVRSPEVFNTLCGEYGLTPQTLRMNNTLVDIIWRNSTRVLETALEYINGDITNSRRYEGLYLLTEAYTTKMSAEIVRLFDIPRHEAATLLSPERVRAIYDE